MTDRERPAELHVRIRSIRVDASLAPKPERLRAEITEGIAAAVTGTVTGAEGSAALGRLVGEAVATRMEELGLRTAAGGATGRSPARAGSKPEGG